MAYKLTKHKKLEQIICTLMLNLSPQEYPKISFSVLFYSLSLFMTAYKFCRNAQINCYADEIAIVFTAHSDAELQV